METSPTLPWHQKIVGTWAKYGERNIIIIFSHFQCTLNTVYGRRAQKWWTSMESCMLILQGEQNVSVHLTITVHHQVHRDFLNTLYNLPMLFNAVYDFVFIWTWKTFLLWLLKLIEHPNNNFHSCTMHLDAIESFIYPSDAQLDCSKRMLKFTWEHLSCKF